MIWQLPTQATIGGRVYSLHCDFRDMLEIISYFEDPDLPDFLKWEIALALFYEGELPPEHRQEGIAYFQSFFSYGAPDTPQEKLFDWQQDAQAIIADVNQVAGREIRGESFVHWWTFLSWFHAIGQGQLSSLVAIRRKLRQGEKLEPWEQAFYRDHRAQVELKPRYSIEEKAEQERLERLLRQEG